MEMYGNVWKCMEMYENVWKCMEEGMWKYFVMCICYVNHHMGDTVIQYDSIKNEINK